VGIVGKSFLTKAIYDGFMDTAEIESTLGDEERRLAALADLAILDTAPEADFDELAALAADILDMPQAALSLVDKDRQWFKARVALPFEQTHRDIAFCNHTVALREPLIVRDATADPRFSANPLVTAQDGIRFYAGAPLFHSNGQCVGSLCVLDSRPRDDFGEDKLRILEGLARLASRLMATRGERRKGEIAAKVVEATSEAVVAADRDGQIVLVNRAAEDLFGHSSQQALGKSIELLMPDRFRNGHQKKIDNAAAGGPTRLLNTLLELPIKTSDGRELPTELSLAPWGDTGSDGGFAAIFRDITRRKLLEADRQETRNFLDAILENLPAMLFVKEARTGRYVVVNKRAAEIMGYAEEDILGRTDSELFGPVGKDYEKRDAEAILSERPFVYESEHTRADGETFNIRTTRVPMDGPDHPRQFVIGIAEDMTDFRRSEAANYWLARYDGLTGLLNRGSLSSLLSDYVSEGKPFAILSIDLDRFKTVNEQFGHPAGDAALKVVGDRLEELVGRECVVSRAGSDEFVILLRGPRLNDRATTLAYNVVERMAEPIDTRGKVAHIGASVGIALYPEDGETTEKLRENVDLALYRAKKDGRGKVCLFDSQMDAAVRDRRMLEGDLRAAVANGDIKLAYQPVVASSTTDVTSFEALARWKHPTRGHVSPEVFISLAEDCGLIEELGSLLLDQACSDAVKWPEHLCVAVNLSPLQFRSGKLIQTIQSALTRSGLAPERLQLEVTERLVIEDTDETVAQLKELRAQGIHILIDDFGVGHSSLSYFQVLPFDKVKIDKSFIHEIETSRSANAIVEAVIGIGRQLSMGIVAEGVETEKQRKLLTRLGCSHLQGYYFSAAMPPAEVPAFIADMQAPPVRLASTVA
tara:strand:+ start:41715 stop:44333 length:2619 start_codon:yes stop_codon:yes gene_type:complete